MATAAVARLPDEILEDIFTRLDAAADLARASMACTSFRRVVSAHRFLRRYRSLHPPPPLGFFLQQSGADSAPPSFLPAEPPHRGAPAAQALAQAADVAFSFLPDPGSWRVRDARDGRVLLSRRAATTTTTFAELVVCDPVHRRYILIPSVPGDLAASIRYREGTEFEPFFIPAEGPVENDQEAAASFRVIYNVQSHYKVVTFLFSSVTGTWCEVGSFSFLPYARIKRPGRHKRFYAHRCFFWMHQSWNNLLVLDTRDMEFSVLALPPGKAVRNIVGILDAGEDKLGLLTRLDFGTRNFDLYCRTWSNNGVVAEEWQHSDTIPLPEVNCDWNVVGAADGYLILEAADSSRVSIPCFTLEYKTLLVERLCKIDCSTYDPHLYVSFAPSLSLPSI